MNMDTTKQAEIDNAIAASMEDLRHGIEDAVQQAERTSAAAPPQSELERFQASIERQHELLRKRMVTTESRYQLERARTLNDFWLRFQQLEYELAEAVRALDQAHDRQVASDRK